MQWLKSETDDAWLKAALSDVDALLKDHAHCEHKAAVTALSMVSRYPDDAVMVDALSALAAEEAGHFRQVAAIVHARGGTIGRPATDTYAKRLMALARQDMVDHLVDRLLVAALIEARSCERLRLLSVSLPDDKLREFYRALFQAEAMHAKLFVDLAVRALSRGRKLRDDRARDRVMARLDELATHEAAIVDELPRVPAIH